MPSIERFWTPQAPAITKSPGAILDRKATRRARRRDAPSQIFSLRPVFLHVINELLLFWQLTGINENSSAGVLPDSADRQIPGTSHIISLLRRRAEVLFERALPGIGGLTLSSIFSDLKIRSITSLEMMLFSNAAALIR